MPSTFSGILYLKSVQTYDKSIDMLIWMQVGLRASGGDKVRLRERQAQPRNFEFFPNKWTSRWGCGDRIFLLMNDLVRRSSCHHHVSIGNHLNHRFISQEIQGWISWSHSALYWAYWENLCSFWYFYVDVPYHGPHVYLWQPTSKGPCMRRLVSSRQ